MDVDKIAEPRKIFVSSIFLFLIVVYSYGLLGEHHTRQRKAIQGAFGVPEIKAVTEIFQEKGEKVSSKFESRSMSKLMTYFLQLVEILNGHITNGPNHDFVEMNIHPWLTSVAVESIGDCG